MAGEQAGADGAAGAWKQHAQALQSRLDSREASCRKYKVCLHGCCAALSGRHCGKGGGQGGGRSRVARGCYAAAVIGDVGAPRARPFACSTLGFRDSHPPPGGCACLEAKAGRRSGRVCGLSGRGGASTSDRGDGGQPARGGSAQAPGGATAPGPRRSVCLAGLPGLCSVRVTVDSREVGHACPGEFARRGSAGATPRARPPSHAHRMHPQKQSRGRRLHWPRLRWRRP